MSKWLSLSYPLNDKAFGYGNGDRFQLNRLRVMANGDTSNNSSFAMPSHYGTHIDFPYHFAVDGKNLSDYSANDFVYHHVGLISIEDEKIPDLLIRNIHLEKIETLNHQIDLLIIKTGFCHKRTQEEYWQKGYGFHPETAAYLKLHFPQLRAIAFDLISLNSYQHRELGRVAHKAFLIEQDVLIIEEMDLRNVDESTRITKAIVAPILLEGADGAPVNFLVEIAANHD